MVREMTRSMSYSRCLRIAIVIAAGMPNHAMTATAAYAMPVSQGWLAPVSSNAIARQMTNATAARASHLTCCRSSGPPARYPHGERHERDRQERDKHRGHPTDRADQDHPQHRRQPVNAERVAEGQRDSADPGELHQPRPQDQADGAQPGQQDASRGCRPPTRYPANSARPSKPSTTVADLRTSLAEVRYQRLAG
jgi:hypothetical protein